VHWKTGRSEWRYCVFALPDARFGGRQEGAGDLRAVCLDGSEMRVRWVAVIGAAPSGPADGVRPPEKPRLGTGQPLRDSAPVPWLSARPQRSALRSVGRALRELC
jgi:hypothetical protein